MCSPMTSGPMTRDGGIPTTTGVDFHQEPAVRENSPRRASGKGFFSPMAGGPQNSPERQRRNFYSLRPAGAKRVLGRSRLLSCCVLTRDGANSICIVVILLLVVVVFMLGVLPRGEIYSYVVVALLATAALVCLVMSVTVDPGILLPLPPEPSRQPETVLVNGKEVLRKVCPSCHIVRPPRSSHCRFCDYCVEEFDHHCGVLGSCVAKRTFRFFGGFFVITALLILFIGIRSLVALARSDAQLDTGQGRWEMAAAIISLVASGLGGCIVLPLAFYYVYLACTNYTQKETAQLSPGFCEPNHDYHQGYWRNFFSRYFGPLGKSRITAENAECYV
ncbi:hypothetical protein MOQ_004511 [Trypanosoma cruzi marinkellei]|uniref:Palmitoyltransferase n=1 Tax=Trypanosoma cruzi marinkellei TaxID=85056 RepID=K2N116_TRYCR|nr:hypothetical protein MOQ_004511 [Trypanosoma cruzi marinkellei]